MTKGVKVEGGKCLVARPTLRVHLSNFPGLYALLGDLPVSDWGTTLCVHAERGLSGASIGLSTLPSHGSPTATAAAPHTAPTAVIATPPASSPAAPSVIAPPLVPARTLGTLTRDTRPVEDLDDGCS